MIIKFNEFLNSELNEAIKTKKGSYIRRYKNVGKKMGNDLYFHKKYVDEYIDEDTFNEYKKHLPKNAKFTIIKYNDKNETISFIYSPDFNTADEPLVSDAYKVTKDGKVTLTKEKTPPQIYHHKWLFVKDDYKGFNVDKSKERSKEWLEVSDKINMSKIGSKRYWEDDVLPLIENKLWDKPDQEYTSAKTSQNQIPKPVSKLLNANELKDRSVNLDIGGGKYDHMSQLLAEWGIKNYVYDPFNRSDEHNEYVISKTSNGKSDTVTIFNVLNVIPDRKNQINTLKQAKNALKKGGKVFVYSNYYVKGKEPGPIKGRDSYQQYYKLKDIVSDVTQATKNISDAQQTILDNISESQRTVQQMSSSIDDVTKRFSTIDESLGNAFSQITSNLNSTTAELSKFHNEIDKNFKEAGVTEAL